MNRQDITVMTRQHLFSLDSITFLQFNHNRSLINNNEKDVDKLKPVCYTIM